MSPWQRHQESLCRAEIPAVVAAAAPWPQQGEGAAGGLGVACGGHAGMAAPWGAPVPRLHAAPCKRDGMSRQGRCRYQRRRFHLCQHSGPGRSLGELASVPGLAVRAPRAPSSDGDGVGVQHARMPWDPGCGACPGHGSTNRVQGGEPPAPRESLSHQGAGQAAPLLLFARHPAVARLWRREWGDGGGGESEPPTAQPVWQGGKRAAGQPGGTRLSREAPAKVTETGTQEHPCGAERTLGIFFPSL